MITIRMMSEIDSDRMIFSVSGLCGSEMEVFAAMFAGMLKNNPNVDFQNLGNCTDLEPLKENQTPVKIPEKLNEENNDLIYESTSTLKATTTDSAVELIEADDNENNNESDNENNNEDMISDPNSHVLLNISYSERQKAKDLLKGLIHWDREGKHWYCFAKGLDDVIEKTAGWKEKEDLLKK